MSFYGEVISDFVHEGASLMQEGATVLTRDAKYPA